MSAPGLDNLILDYLRLKGYHKAADDLKSHGISPALPASDEGPLSGQEMQKKLVKELKSWAADAETDGMSGMRTSTPFEAEARLINSTSVQFGWLEDDLEAECSAVLEQESAQEHPTVDPDWLASSRKLKQQESDSTLRKRRQRTVVPAQIPLPAHSEEIERMMLQSMRTRSHVCESQLPSAAMYTFLNVPSNLNDSLVLYDGSKIAGAFDDSLIKVFDINASKPMPESCEDSLPNDPKTGETQPVKILSGHSKGVISLSWFEEDELVLSCSLDGTIRLWSERLASALVVFKGHLFPVWDVAACPRGYYFASASIDKTARLWCTERLEAIRLFAGHKESVDTVRWHPSCNILATSSADRTIRLWDIASGRCIRMLPGLLSRVTTMTFGADARSLLCGHEDGQISSWDIVQASGIGCWDGHNGPVWSMALSHGNGELLATGGEDDAMKIWSVNGSNGMLNLVKTLATRGTPVQSITWTNSNFLVGAGSPRLLKS